MNGMLLMVLGLAALAASPAAGLLDRLINRTPPTGESH